MKKLTLLIVSCMTLNGISSELTQREKELKAFYDEISAFYKTMNSLKVSPSEESILRFLQDTRGKEWWNMNAMLGPLDTDSNQIEVLGAFSSYLLNDKGEYVGAIRHSDDPDIQRWIDWLSVSPTDTDDILKMLDSSDSPVRWLGLKKVSTMDRLPDSIVTKLENIVQTDDYVRIVRDPPTWGLGNYYPPMPGTTVLPVEKFSSPLREDAALILQKLGMQDVVIDNYQVALRGVVYFNELCESDRNKWWFISRALFYVQGDGAGLWQEINSQRDKYPQFSALFQAWDERLIYLEELTGRARKNWEELVSTNEQVRMFILEGKMEPPYFMTADEAKQIAEKYNTQDKPSEDIAAKDVVVPSVKSSCNRWYIGIGVLAVLGVGGVTYFVRRNK